MNRRDFAAQFALTGLGTAALVAVGTPVLAQGGPVEGKQYTRIDPPVAPIMPGKIEVIEFFSYACPHCNAFEPTVEAWSKKLPADVNFHRVPVPFLMNFENLMKTYYALDSMGLVGQMQRKVFAAIHIDHNTLEKPADITALMARNGVDAAKFTAAFNSFSVASSITRAKKLFASYKIDGVPTLVVQGRYETSPGLAGGFDETFSVVDFLVQRARKG
ncbi:MAG: thiol:disulfide interchange protein DsbA/DsbL [Pseudomonadota bacterium]|nr:thiol:disulfide interchange protein DsbA/DsbL [Pseudomonadota bacterium]